mmetsp:Transcript_90021/g.239171  ORF Transcript_90021/g.239171 Transcript_90021/m.239171 type:complete len:324 (-) Transcript_90021:68-1039(-)
MSEAGYASAPDLHSHAGSRQSPAESVRSSRGSSGARWAGRHESGRGGSSTGRRGSGTPGCSSQSASQAGEQADPNLDSQIFGSQFDSQAFGPTTGDFAAVDEEGVSGELCVADMTNLGDEDQSSSVSAASVTNRGAGAGGMSRSKSTPGPGQYAWRDSIHLRKKPSWTMQVPERKNLDLMVGSWTPASSSQQPRAPGPVYDSPPGVGGKYGPPKWSYARASGRPCLAQDPPKRAELTITLPSTFGGVSPTLKRVPQWSVFGKDRSSLPYDTPTWTPKMESDVRPGPGQHDVSRMPNWKPRNRRGCTWGGRTGLPSKYPNLGAT